MGGSEQQNTISIFKLRNRLLEFISIRIVLFEENWTRVIIKGEIVFHKFTMGVALDHLIRFSKIVQQQKTFRLPYDWWPLPQEIHGISSDCNNRR